MSSTSERRRIPVIIVAVGLATAACSGGEPAASASPSSTPMEADATTVAPLSPPQFAAALADAFVVNVHVPDEGSIAGTDAAIPYDKVRARSAELPRDRDAPVAVYCKSGRMSAEAVAILQDLGYTEVVELRGGMDAWVADGQQLLPPAG